MYASSDPADRVPVGHYVRFRLTLEDNEDPGDYFIHLVDQQEVNVPLDGEDNHGVTRSMAPLEDFEPLFRPTYPGTYTLRWRRLGEHEEREGHSLTVTAVADRSDTPLVTRVALVPAGAPDSSQDDLWTFIEEVSRRLRFDEFAEAVRPELCAPDDPRAPYGVRTYQHLHTLARRFVTRTALGGSFTGGGASSLADRAIGLSYVAGQDDGVEPFPYDLGPCDYPLGKVPFVELIYVYWLEEAMLYQSLNHIMARFQNRRVGGHDALARLSVSPLMPLREILWGLAESERERLSVRRRAAEYEYQYGLQLIGRAIPPAETLVERRTQFLQAFHGLLNASLRYYKERDDKTVEADAFPLLSGLRELHLVLARGANNQFADLPLQARIETMDVQWMLAQPEMRMFLGGPTMVPYEEPWMDRVDTMKTLQGWADASVTHFHDLALQGEKLLLSVRHGRWNESGLKREDAENWAVQWRNAIQRYVHAYRAVTGVDLSEHIDTTMPSTLLSRRLAQQFARA